MLTCSCPFCKFCERYWAEVEAAGEYYRKLENKTLYGSDAEEVYLAQEAQEENVKRGED